MAVFRYQKEVEVDDDDDVILTIRMSNTGTTSHHIVDTPAYEDLEGKDDYERNLGKGALMKKERTLIFSKAANFDPAVAKLEITYAINSDVVIHHVNKKSADPSPQIKVKLTFS